MKPQRNTHEHRLWIAIIRVHLCLSVVALFYLSSFVWAGGKPRMENVAGKIACYCGTCPHLVVTACGCSVADQIKAEIQKMIDNGQTEEQILQSYVAKYGQTVLAAPTKSGFNLTAWAIPFIAFFGGGGALFLYLKKQRSLPQAPADSDDSKPFDDKEVYYRELLKKELEDRK